MPLYTVLVDETRTFLMRYTVEAESESEALELAERGENIEETQVSDYGDTVARTPDPATLEPIKESI